MTRLLFVEQQKAGEHVDSVAAQLKDGKVPVEIVPDNPKIIKERYAKSLPPIPAPPAAPEDPHGVEGWKGIKVGGWLGSSKKDVKDDKPPAPPTEEVAAMSVDDTKKSPAVPMERRKQLFPENSRRGLAPGDKSDRKLKPTNSGSGSRRSLGLFKKKSSKGKNVGGGSGSGSGSE